MRLARRVLAITPPCGCVFVDITTWVSYDNEYVVCECERCNATFSRRIDVPRMPTPTVQ